MTLLVVASLAVAVTSCAHSTADSGPPYGPELAPYMGQLERHASKLGLSILAENEELATFYLDEVDEILAEISEDIPEHDGFDLASLVQIIMQPAVNELRDSVAEHDGREWGAFGNLIDGCNRCHAATEHEFIVLSPTRPDGLRQVFATR